MDTFTVRDLRERTGDLIRDAEQGKLSIITKHGQPVFVAVPFDETVALHLEPVAQVEGERGVAGAGPHQGEAYGTRVT